jgi:predicted DCC family thiol-disulfide oxidoreductase YuxK
MTIVTLLAAWLRPRAVPRATVFYDGQCGLCHRLVRFVLARDAAGAFRFAPLGGETFQSSVPAWRAGALPDSIVVRTADGALLVRTAAVRHVLLALGGPWRIAGGALQLVPAALADRLYDGVARVRHRLFARPAGACPVLPSDLRSRFDP